MLMITGCRRGKIVGMKWSNVNWEDFSILINSALTSTPQRGVYERKRQKQVLLSIIGNELTESQRDIFIMYYMEELKMPAIAKRLGINKSTVSRTLGRAKKRIYRITQYL